MAGLNLVRQEFHGEWNYSMYPKTLSRNWSSYFQMTPKTSKNRIRVISAPAGRRKNCSISFHNNFWPSLSVVFSLFGFLRLRLRLIIYLDELNLPMNKTPKDYFKMFLAKDENNLIKNAWKKEKKDWYRKLRFCSLGADDHWLIDIQPFFLFIFKNW